jgi:TetR/AcrR family transcriptional repressor of mexCD-oprJ operon
VSRSDAIQSLVAASILHSASALVGEAGDLPTMSQIADAVGIGRATLYRYYPTREDLMRALGDAALTRTRAQLDQAEIDTVDFPEALARVASVLVEARAEYAVLERAVVKQDKRKVDRKIGAPIRALFSRGLADGSLRPDLSEAQHLELFKHILMAAIKMTSDSQIAPGEAAAIAASIFLNGALVEPVPTPPGTVPGTGHERLATC